MGVNMFDAANIDRLIASRSYRIAQDNYPRHIAIDAGSELKPVKIGHVLAELMKAQVKLSIPIVTVYFGHEIKNLDSFIDIFSELRQSAAVHRYQVKLSVLGKWYDTSGRLVETIKSMIESTKDYDRFFFNLCLNYSGQEEIVDSCRLIARKIKAGKIEIEAISKDMIKENLYSSYFLPPDVIIMTGVKRTWSTLLLWDSAGAFYCFPKRYFTELSEADLLKAISDYSLGH